MYGMRDIHVIQTHKVLFVGGERLLRGLMLKKLEIKAL
jgi:hypothetical protein